MYVPHGQGLLDPRTIQLSALSEKTMQAASVSFLVLSPGT